MAFSAWGGLILDRYWAIHCQAATCRVDLRERARREDGIAGYLNADDSNSGKSLAARARANFCKAPQSTALCFFLLEQAHFFSMASEAGEADQDESVDEEESSPVKNGRPEGENVEEREGSEEEEDEEPRLKYASLTKQLNSVYRNGDATSAFLVAGDKMVIRLLQIQKCEC